MAIQRISFEVRGKVQGVFFRNFVVDLAKQHSLTGWVRNNNTDGTVEGEAQGEEKEVKGPFLTQLKKGNEHSRVDGVDVKDLEVKEGEAGFQKIKNAH